jgi:hypothetical protein
LHSQINDIMIDLKPFVQSILENPKALNSLDLSSSMMQKCFEVVLNYQQLDPKLVSKVGVSGVSPYFTLKNMPFKRSFQTVAQFVCMSKPKNFVLAAVIQRTLCVIDYFRGTILYEIPVKLCNPENLTNPYQNKLAFLDND